MFKIKRFHTFAAMFSALAVMLVFAACGGPEPAGSSAPASSAAQTTETAATGTTATAPAQTDGTTGPTATTGTRAVTTHIAVTTKPTTQTKAPATTTAPQAPAYSQNTVEFIGRFVQEGQSYRFEWSGSTITGGFIGTEIAVNLRIISFGPDTDCDYFNVSIDGGAPTVLKVTKDKTKYVLASGLKNAHHTVSIQKRTEGPFGCLMSFDGFDYLTGKAAAAPARKSRRIEVYGDSISAGYGNEGTQDGFRLVEENAGLTYGMLAAEELGAECTLIALSGHGVYQSLSGSKTQVTPAYFPRALYKDPVRWGFPAPAPDAVIINLGANDIAMQVSEGDFYNAYSKFVTDIRRKYPKTFIVCMTGGGTYEYVSVMERVVDDTIVKAGGKGNGAKIGLFTTIYDDVNGAQGSDGHPSVYGHRQLAAALADYLREQLNW